MTALHPQSNPASKARLIPEKTVELWNAFALRDILGPNTWIWSPPKGMDQAAGLVEASRLKKVFFLELKAPYRSPSNLTAEVDFQINTEQLRKYVSHYVPATMSDVLYVLPYTNWHNPPSSILPPEADPEIRTGFTEWTFVIRASHLYRFLRMVRIRSGHRALPKSATVHLKVPHQLDLSSSRDSDRLWEETESPFLPWAPRPSARAWLRYCTNHTNTAYYESSFIDCTTLSHVLHLLKYCQERRKIAFRSLDYARDGPLPNDPFIDLCSRYIGVSDSSEWNDQIPSEREWPEDVDLDLTDDNLNAASNALFVPNAYERDRGVDDDHRPRDEGPDDGVPTSSTLRAVGVG